MKVYYKSYLDFVTKAQVLAQALGLTHHGASELLAKISGYNSLGHMKIGEKRSAPTVLRTVIVSRLVALRPELSLERASELVDQMGLSFMQEP